MTPVYAAYLAPARATNQLWRLGLGFALILGIYAGWMTLMGGLLWLAQGSTGFERQMERLAAGADPWSLIWLLFSFLGGWLGVALTLRLLHRRRLRSLFGRAPVVLRDFVLGVGLIAVISGGVTLAASPFLPPLQMTADPRLWALFLPLALAGIAVQTGAEELVFRGYLQGQLAARFAFAPLWLGLPSLLFGLAHYAPQAMGAQTWLIVASTALFGLVAADMTARTGSLGLAWGLHFANNVMAILMVSLTGHLDGLALFHLQPGVIPPEALRMLLLGDMALMGLVWLGARLWLRRR